MKQNHKTRRAFALSSIALTALAFSSLTLPLKAEDGLPKNAEIFEVGENMAFVYAAPKPAQGKPWLWYAPTLKSLAPAERRGYYETFVNAGISIAGFDLGEVRGSPASTAKFTLFYDAMVKRGYSPKPILLGQSRGGMMTLAWAFRNPDKVRAWVGIYPVCSLASWSLTSSKKETLADFAMTEPELVAKLAEFNPIDNLQGLLANKVPMFAVHGDVDKLVPYDLNTKLLKERYEAGGGSIQVKVIPGKGHLYEQENVRITGKGVINGNGGYWWSKFWGKDRKGGMLADYTKRGLRWAVDYDCERVRGVVVWKSAISGSRTSP